MGSSNRHCTRSSSRVNSGRSAFSPTIGVCGCNLLSFKESEFQSSGVGPEWISDLDWSFVEDCAQPEETVVRSSKRIPSCQFVRNEDHLHWLKLIEHAISRHRSQRCAAAKQ